MLDLDTLAERTVDEMRGMASVVEAGIGADLLAGVFDELAALQSAMLRLNQALERECWRA